MLFNSLPFLIFFPVVTLVYAVIPKKMRCIWLLAASYFFYMCWNYKFIVLILTSTLITWISGLFLDHFQRTASCDPQRRKQKATVAVAFVVDLGILAFFKYANFFIDNVNGVLSLFHVQAVELPFDIILPVGISFFTFQALSYTMDVYRGTIQAEKSLLRYALFVSFYPQLVAGPIERSGNLLKQIDEIEHIKIYQPSRIVKGLTLMLWGLFLKLVIADRIAILVNTVFDSYMSYGSVELALGMVGFAIQIYCDFSSYSIIAIGASNVMGFDLMENFRAPYLSKSIKEFWRRWHISLSTWFKDYLYIPLGGNRCSKARNYLNLMITFLVSGLWHGANWTFIVWGCLHGVYQVCGALLQKPKAWIIQKMNIRTEPFSYRLGQTVLTFALVCFAWVFFRADSLGDAIQYLGRMFGTWNPWVLFNDQLLTLGLSQMEWNILLFSLSLLVIVDLLVYFRPNEHTAYEIFRQQNGLFRYLVCLVLALMIVVFGIYGPAYSAQDFIYFQF